jgi:FkbM family methyltransferase
LSFSLFEIGARPVGEHEPFYDLLRAFPRSSLIGFEPEAELCAEMQRTAPAGARYLAHALGSRREKRPLYVTRHPMCSSLYEPDARYIEMFNALEVQALDRVVEVETVDLDGVIADYALAPPDFIKIDIQGAELDVFRGAERSLGSVLQIISEVEFAPMYRSQPLFGDVDRFLRERGLIFHKFGGLSGRMIRPMALADNPAFAVQHLWTDAVFVRDYFRLDALTGEALLKAAVLADLYGSPDLAAKLLSEHDRRGGAQRTYAYVNELMRAAQAAPQPPRQSFW